MCNVSVAHLDDGFKVVNISLLTPLNDGCEPSQILRKVYEFGIVPQFYKKLCLLRSFACWSMTIPLNIKALTCHFLVAYYFKSVNPLHCPLVAPCRLRT